MNISLGLTSVSFRKNSPEEILAAMQNTGLSCIEWGSDIHAPYHDICRLNQLAAWGKEYSVSCSSYGTYFRAGVNTAEELLPYIQAAKILGTDRLRIWCGNKNSGDYTVPEQRALFTACQTLAAIAEKEHVTLCLECHPNTYTDTKGGALAVMQAVASKHLQMYWQPHPFETEAENLAYAKAISPYVKAVHVFHWQENKRFPLAEGASVWKRYLSNFSTSPTLLLEFMPDDCLTSLQAEAQALVSITRE